MEDTFEWRRNRMFHEQRRQQFVEDLSQKKLPGIPLPTCAPPFKPGMAKTYNALKAQYRMFEYGQTTNRPTIGRPNINIYKGQ